MTGDEASSKNKHQKMPGPTPLASTYYGLLGVHPSASGREIRRSYRELSKRYHPDTTDLPRAIAIAKFQQLNEAYATLSNPERRLAYDRTIRYSHIPVIQPPDGFISTGKPSHVPQPCSATYLDPSDRPLSGGEIFALFILGVTFIGCLLLAIAVGLTRGETAFPPVEFNAELKQTVPVPEATSELLPIAAPVIPQKARSDKLSVKSRIF